MAWFGAVFGAVFGAWCKVLSKDAKLIGAVCGCKANKQGLRWCGCCVWCLVWCKANEQG